MKYRQLGRTGITVSEIGLGCLPLDGMSYGALAEEDALALIRSALAEGCTVFDTGPAWGGGESERRLGKALSSQQREQIVLITRGSADGDASSAHLSGGKPGGRHFSEEMLEKTLVESLQRLKTTYLDCFLLQTPSLELIQQGEVFELLQRWKQRGDIRSYGVSIHDPMEGVLAIIRGPVDCIEVAYHFFDRRPEQLHAGESLLSRCERAQVGMIIREPLANGFLGGQFQSEALPAFSPGDLRGKWPLLYLKKRIAAAETFQALREHPVFKDVVQKNTVQKTVSLPQLALCFALRHPAVSTVVPGMKTLLQLKENTAASELPQLADGFEALLDECAANVF